MNGHTSARFNASTSTFKHTGALSTWVGSSAWSFWCLFNPTAINSDHIFYDTAGYFEMGAGQTGYPQGFFALQDDGSSHIAVTSNMSTSAWHLLQARYDSSDPLSLKARLDSGGWMKVACGSIGALPGSPTIIGGPADGTGTLHGDVLELAISDTLFDDATFDNILRYINTRYGLSL